MEEKIQQDLKEALFKSFVLVLRNSGKYITKESAALEVIGYCANQLDVEIDMCPPKCMQIHPENMKIIDEKWSSLTKILHDELNIYKIVKSSKFVNVLDIQKLLTLLGNKTDNDPFMNHLLAIDGFQGQDYKNYIENLKIASDTPGHVRAVRSIYRNIDNVNSESMYLALLHVFEKFAKDDEVQQVLKNNISENNINVDEIVYLYEKEMQDEDLEMIAVIKLTQLMNKAKKQKKLQYRKKDVLKENDQLPKKRKVVAILSEEED